MSARARRLRPSVAGAALVLSASVAGAALLAIGPGVANAADAAVAATGANTFNPDRVGILVGDAVTWTTTGGVNHTVTSSSPNWTKDSSIPLISRSTSFTFDKAGTYTYFCKTHGSATTGMRGTVVVAAPKPAPRPTTAAPRPTATRSPSARPTSATPSPSRTRSPSPSPPSSEASTARGPALGVPSVAPGALPSKSDVPLPAVAPEPEQTASDEPLVDLGSGGLGPRPTTDRGRGLPAFIALVALGGVVSAQIRALLAMPPSEQ